MQSFVREPFSLGTITTMAIKQSKHKAREKSREPIGHFRITLNLFHKASLGAHPFI